MDLSKASPPSVLCKSLIFATFRRLHKPIFSSLRQPLDSINLLADKNRFPLSSFVWVDPDQIRHCLPEFDLLVRYDASEAGTRTRKEAGMMAEILTKAALEQGHSVIVDGSLRDVDWYKDYFEYLKQRFPSTKIAILYITAPRSAIFERAAVRSRIFSF